ncbi:substrate-binding domain-containing protein [Rickettsiales endosymbiont of Stachyamoeba lipophora]|uniref:substrate-binding domain-containing protein n=1 Tax=Rickettsiales endosymbiont of Stachyamoeba lipophora TaxID=2486578 RepID=UPI000F64F52E|nr:substrate-binding domain-containing protein [Rickettsiales endosymbiont of Stachyamoeba lipophora]AZL15012.1 hypothetical protein EF513_00305 [Rickettsiales endosymbiont of Stachyamoeba lipophora]
MVKMVSIGNTQIKRCIINIISKLIIAISFISYSNLGMAESSFRMSGSLVLYPLMTVIAEDYHEDFNYPAPIVENVGSGPGFRLFCLNKFYSPQIVMASRPITQSEVKLCAQNGINKIAKLVIGSDALVIAISKNTPLGITSLSTEQLVNTLAHPKFKTWRDINPSFPKKVIKIHGPNSNSGGYDIIKDIVTKNTTNSIKQNMYIENGNNQNLIIQKIVNDPYALGLIDIGYFYANTHQLRILALDDFTVNDENILNGNYALSRKLILYYDEQMIKSDPKFAHLIDYLKKYYTKRREAFSALGITPVSN